MDSDRDLKPYPAQHHGPAPRSRARRTAYVAAAAVAGVALLGGLGTLGENAVLYAFNPVGDEWHCSDGEAPAGPDGAGGACYRTDEPLPAGLEWDPFGNRPMAYNCQRSGWVQIARDTRKGEVVEDCVREGTELPPRWRVVDAD